MPIQYQTASYGGIEFGTTVCEVSPGRRIVQHKYPLRDDALYEDLGKVPREFTMDCFVVGDDWIAKSIALIDAFELPGPKMLVHPIYGAMKVSLTSEVPRITHTMKTQRRFDFTVTFARVDPATTLKNETMLRSTQDATVDAREAVNAAAVADAVGVTPDAAAISPASPSAGTIPVAPSTKTLAGADKPKKRFWDRQAPRFTVPQSVRDMQSVGKAIRRSIQSYIALPNDVQAEFFEQWNFYDQEIAGLAGDFTGMTTQLISTAAWVRDLTTGKLQPALIDAWWNLLVLPNESLNDLFDLPIVFGAAGDQVDAVTKLNASNRDTIKLVMKTTAAGEAAATVGRTQFASQQQSAAYATKLGDAMDALMLELSDAGWDDTYEQVDNLRAVTLDAIKQNGSTLATVENVTVQAGPWSTLVEAYRRYQDLDRATEIAERNPSVIHHPGFIPAGTPFEVLSE